MNNLGLVLPGATGDNSRVGQANKINPDFMMKDQRMVLE